MTQPNEADGVTARDWAGAKEAIRLVGLFDAVSPVHIAQAERAPQPDDCLYRYEAEEIVVRELARLRTIEAAARAAVDGNPSYRDGLAALRAALETK